MWHFSLRQMIKLRLMQQIRPAKYRIHEYGQIGKFEKLSNSLGHPAAKLIHLFYLLPSQMIHVAF